MAYQRFVAIGDSFTEGVGDPRPNGRDRGWADRVAETLGRDDPDFGYANLAIRGRRVLQIVEEQVPLAVGMAPDLVTFSGGINDALRRTWDLPRLAFALESAISDLRATGADVVVLTFGRPSRRSRLMASVEGRLAAYRDMTLDVVDRYECKIVDFWDYPAFADSRFWSEDRLHLNEVGHQRVASAVMDSLGHPPAVPWWEPLPPVSGQSLVARAGGNVAWAGRHLGPWIGRRLTGRSSGDGLAPKRPELAPVS